MITGFLELMSKRLNAEYIDKRIGLVVPMTRHESGQPKKTLPVIATSNELVAMDDKKMSILFFEKEGRFSADTSHETMMFKTNCRAVLWINKSKVNKDDPLIGDKVAKHFFDLINSFKLRSVEGYTVNKIIATSVSNDPAQVFSKYTFSEMINFTHHPYECISVDFFLQFSYCQPDIIVNPKC